MGSPVSPPVACIFMSRLEEHALATFQTRPSTWYRFMDDVFAIVKKTVVNDLLAHLNDQNSSIKFTMESEKDGKLPFMDVIVTRCGGNKLGTTVYRKATHTGRYLHFNSNNPESLKRSVSV